MSTRLDGGPAFPRPAGENTWEGQSNAPQEGMSLRDYFAGCAIPALLDGATEMDYPSRAERAYSFADHLIVARDGGVGLDEQLATARTLLARVEIDRQRLLGDGFTGDEMANQVDRFLGGLDA